jgi:hypothetical protein
MQVFSLIKFTCTVCQTPSDVIMTSEGQEGDQNNAALKLPKRRAGNSGIAQLIGQFRNCPKPLGNSGIARALELPATYIYIFCKVKNFYF